MSMVWPTVDTLWHNITAFNKVDELFMHTFILFTNTVETQNTNTAFKLVLVHANRPHSKKSLKLNSVQYD